MWVLKIIKEPFFIFPELSKDIDLVVTIAPADIGLALLILSLLENTIERQSA